MRIRGTKPEFWRSKHIAAVSWDARLVLKGLESYVDDNGVGPDDVELITSDLFSRDLAREGSRILARVSEAISELHRAGLVWRYSAEGEELLYISCWEQAQRVDKPQAGRFPRPDGTMNYKDSVIREYVASPREDSRTFAPGTGEQGNRGTGEQLVPDASVTVTSARDTRERGDAPGYPADPEDDNHPPALVDTDSKPTASGIVREWERASGVTQNDATRAGMRLAVAQCLRAGHPADVIARGIADWASSPIVATTQIPAFVDRAAVRPRLAPVPAASWDDIARAADAAERALP